MLYNHVIEALPTIANELKGTNQISQKSVEQLFEKKGFQTFNVSDGFLRSDTVYKSSWKADKLPIK